MSVSWRRHLSGYHRVSRHSKDTSTCYEVRLKYTESKRRGPNRLLHIRIPLDEKLNRENFPGTPGSGITVTSGELPCFPFESRSVCWRAVHCKEGSDKQGPGMCRGKVHLGGPSTMFPSKDRDEVRMTSEFGLSQSPTEN